ncbi:hypothetical protein BDP27DRAFT_88104 [Rhodocollybia butyracea]|uniref:Uncharacterized protein n=1 Tax=Rhodocollybia butyracea TaxID=206335 RepID=A0A9P5Q4Y7_9AGAR|nr:hypothetical protein BDP27DRAFT_88104 [Rhodocollybia butyracea]
MDFPSLKSLSVRYDSRDPVSRFPSHRMSLNNLETLGLHLQLTPEAMTNCLLSVPNITSLYFVDTGNWDGPGEHSYMVSTTLQDTHLSRLGLPAGNPSSLCPRLRHVKMIDYAPWSLNCEYWSGIALADFLEARVRSKALVSFDLYFHEPTRTSRSYLEAQLGRFVQLKELGLELHLHQSHVPSRSADDLPTAGLYPMRYFGDLSKDTDTIV